MSKGILLWDIESTSLNADFGIILCIGYKWFGHKTVHVIRIDEGPRYKKDKGDDSYVVGKFIEVLSSADIQVTWYGKRFDEPMLRARMMFNKMDVGEDKTNIFPPVPHIDLWETARRELKLSSNRLKSVQSFLDLPDEKSEVKGRIWLDAIMGKQGALKYIVDHCKKDVLVLEQAYERLRPIIRVNRPNIRTIAGTDDMLCPACGSDRLKSWGIRCTLVTRYRRYRCLACGAWCSAPPTQPKKVR